MFRSKSIKTRYMWAGMIICLVSLSLVSGVSYFASSRITTELLDTHVSKLAESKAREFDTWLEIKEIIIASMAQDIEASENFSNENLAKLIENKMRLHAKELIDIYIGFENRSPSLISGIGWNAPADYDPRTRDWYMEAAQTQKVIFTKPYVDAMTGELVITVARALRHNGQLMGVLATDIYITELIRLVNSLNVSDGGYSLLLDENGRIIAHPEKNFLPTTDGLRPVESIPWATFPRLVDILKGGKFSEKIVLTGPEGGKEYYIFSQMRKTNWFFGIAMSRAQYEEPLDLLLKGFAGAFLLSVLGGILVMFRLVKGMIRPIQNLTLAVENFANNDFSSRALVLSDDEIGRLAQSFNGMAATIEDYSRTLENMVEERTRELQTKNMLIMDSITYARRLQDAIRPTLHMHAGLEPHRCFSIWLPRDTVGGDMYWCRSEGDFSLITLADCTGHGVSGALMVMTLNSILDSTLRECGYISPARIMRILHTRLKQHLRQNEAESKINDGADMAMLLVERKTRKLLFCGARISLFTCMDGKMEEVRGGRHSIGYASDQEVHFEDRDIPWENNLRIYLTSDGLLDQHRQTGRVGMGKRGFMHMVEALAHLPMPRQKEEIEKEISLRITSVPQRDDICVLGIELD